MSNLYKGPSINASFQVSVHLAEGSVHLKPTTCRCIKSPATLHLMVILWWDLQLPRQSVPITTSVVISNPAHGKMYLIQHYVIKFVSDLQQVGGF
jgi:hypothetical protein